MSMEFSLSEQVWDFFSKLNSLIGFKMFIDVAFVNNVFSFENAPISELAKRLGFESHLTAVNNSSVYMALLSLVLIALVAKLISRFESNCRLISMCKVKIINALFWSGFCEFINCTYLVLAIGFGLNLKDIRFDSLSFAINSILAICNALVVMCFPVWLVFKLRQGWMIKAPKSL